MDFSVLDLGQSSPTARDRGTGREVLHADDGLFADALLEIADFRDIGPYDEAETIADDADASSRDADADDDTDVNDDTDNTASDRHPDGQAADVVLANSADTTTLLQQITAGVTANTGQGVPATHGGETTQAVPAAHLTAQASSAAALQGEIRVLAKRSDTITANEKHVQGIKAELAGKAGEAATNTGSNGQPAKGDITPAPAPAGREAAAPNSDIARLEQTLRQVFPSAPGENASAASAQSATNTVPRPGGEALLAQRGADQSVESGSHLASTGERPTPVATAKAAAARPSFNLPAGRPAEQVSVQIQNGLRNGSDRIQIKLTPASLGTVEVKLELSPDKTVQAIVSADKPETLDMLERDARVLQKALEEAGLKTNSDSLSFSQRESGNSADAQGRDNDRAASGDTGNGDPADLADNADTETEVQARRTHDGLIDIEA